VLYWFNLEFEGIVAESATFVVAALVVRFITRRYIGEYDPNLEKVYTFHTVMDNEMVLFEILDTAGQPHVSHIYLDCDTV
jgi:hypothetical protein